MAGQSIVFDFLTTGTEKTASGFRKVGDNTFLAAKGAKVLADSIEKLGDKEGRTAAESALLAKALRQTGDAEDRVAARAVLADAAIRRLGDAMQDSTKSSGQMGKALDGLKLNPGLAGPALLLAPALATVAGVAAGAGVALGGAFTAGGLALAGFGAVAKPVLSDAKTAAQAVEKAQNNYAIAIANGTKQSVAYKAEQIAIGKAYAELSPQQIVLSKQIGGMASAWQAVKAAETPVVAGALQPWLKSVTGLIGMLHPIIAKMAPVIHDLGVQFGALVKSDTAARFRDFVATFGALTVKAAGSTLIDFFKAFMIILPQFSPLIGKAVQGIGGLGPAVLKWAGSKATADHITAFMDWFKTNGPRVGQLIKNMGGALAALAPGLTAGAATELNIISGFFAWVAKLPPAIAKPLIETAGALLLLNKMGVVSVGVKMLGMSGLLGGAKGAAEAGLWAKMLPGVRLAGGALVATIIVTTILQNTRGPGDKPGQNIYDNPFGADPKSKDPAKQGLSTWAGLGTQIKIILNGIGHFVADQPKIWISNFVSGLVRDGGHITGWFKGLGGQIAGSFDTSRHQVAAIAAGLAHDVAGSFDQTRHQVAAIWDTTWNNTAGRAGRGVHDVAGWLGNLSAGTASTWAGIRGAAAGAWDTIWNNTVSRTSHGVSDVGNWLGNLRGNAASIWGQIRGAAAGAWDTIWNNTVSRTVNGISAMMGWIGGISGRILGAFTTAGNWLVSGGSNIITGLWNGIKGAWGNVAGWFAGLPSQILHALGINSPPAWAISAGGHIMGGLLKGLAHGASDVKGFFRGIAMDASGPFKSIWGGLASAGKDIWHALFGGGGAGAGVAGPGGGAPAANAALARKLMPAWGSGAEWDAWNYLEMREAGWNQFARNPSSGAYGIPQCYSIDMMILTRRGWLKHDEVQAGDETVGYNLKTERSEWTKVTAVLHPGVHPVVRYGNSRVEFTTTPNHRWLMGDDWRPGLVKGLTAIQDRGRGDVLILAKEHHAEDGLPITLEEAALLGWIAGDGWESKARVIEATGRNKYCPHCDRGTKNKFRPMTYHIAQTKEANWGPIEAAVDGHGAVSRTRHDRVIDGETRRDREWRLSAPYARDLTERAGNPKTDCVDIVLRMSSTQRKTWLNAVFLAEGHTQPGFRSISQNEGSLAEAVKIAVYLEGYRPGIYRRKEGHRQHEVRIGFIKPTLMVRNPGFFYEDAGEQEVWCVTTELGSFTAEQNGHIHLTGNSLPPEKMGAAANPPQSNPTAQINWMISYIKGRYGDPINAAAHERSMNWYAGGTSGAAPGWGWVGERGPELVKFSGGEQVLSTEKLGGYADGTAGAGAAWLKAWQTRHGGGFGAAWAPVVLNEQIAQMAAAIGRAQTLSKAGGLTAGQHQFWSSAAADETRRLGVLNRELTTERAWRYQLQLNELGLDKEIRAAGDLPSLAGNVRAWKAQMATQKATVDSISGMLGYSNAYLAAHPPAPVLPGVTHTYGGDVTGTNAAFLASALGPFTGTSPVTMDKGGWLPPGLTSVWNGTGRPEPVGAARGSSVIHLEVSGGQSEFDQFMLAWIRRHAKIKGGGNVQVAFGAR